MCHNLASFALTSPRDDDANDKFKAVFTYDANDAFLIKSRHFIARVAAEFVRVKKKMKARVPILSSERFWRGISRQRSKVGRRKSSKAWGVLNSTRCRWNATWCNIIHNDIGMARMLLFPSSHRYNFQEVSNDQLYQQTIIVGKAHIMLRYLEEFCRLEDCSRDTWQSKRRKIAWISN